MTYAPGQPLHFGTADRPLFGWIHRDADRSAQSSIGLVVCNPFGFDAVCSHRTVRHLAHVATSRGMPCIRFDYDGTGDSAGDEFEPGRVTAWLNSIHAAADALKAATGVERVCLAGIRLGALLATFAAADRTDVAGLVLISPVARGRAYARELRAFQAASVTTDDAEGGLLESGGYVMTAETVAQLEALDIHTVAKKPADNVLILDRADLPVAQKAAEAFKTLGANVSYSTTPDHPYLVRSPSPLELPEHILSTCSTWFDGQLLNKAWSARTDSATAESATTARPHSHSLALLEKAEFIGTDSPLFAITAFHGPQPESGATKPLTGIVLMNAGAVNHLGPSRLYVTLSRKWVQMGYVCMRFDIAGIGDSPAPADAPENVIYAPHALDNISAAVNTLKKQYGVQKVIAIGLCSGAYHSFLAAKSASAKSVSIDSIILMNPLTFYWKDGMALDEGELSPKAAVAAIEGRRYKASLFTLNTWKKLFTGKADLKSFARVVSIQIGTKLMAFGREARRMIGPAPENDLATDMKMIVANRIRPTLIFGSTDLGLPRMQSLGGNALKRQIKKGSVALHIIPGADHTFMQLKHRHVVTSILTDTIAKS